MHFSRYFYFCRFPIQVVYIKYYLKTRSRSKVTHDFHKTITETENYVAVFSRVLSNTYINVNLSFNSDVNLNSIHYKLCIIIFHIVFLIEHIIGTKI